VRDLPTHNGKAIVSGGVVHQGAGAALFVSLPLAGRALAARLLDDERWARTAATVRTLSTAAIALAVAYPVARLLPVVEVAGLVQRVLFGLELGTLLILATRLLRVSAR
jgi:hypothetical protein